MLQNIKHLYGMKLEASDGLIGHVKDFYFDDHSWMVRYLVVDTGTWLLGRQVLLTHHAFAPNAFGRASDKDKILHANLNRKQIENSPSIDAHRPVSRQYEDEYHRYYGWPAYWQGGGMWGVAGVPAATLPPDQENPLHHGHNQRDDIHLRSTSSVVGYQIHATDHPIGSVCGFMLDGTTWAIREVLVETGYWFSRKIISVLPASVGRISYEHSVVYVNLTMAEIEQTANHDVAQADTPPR